MNYNPGLLFYKHYYQKFDFNILLDKSLKEEKEKYWKKTPSKNPFYDLNKDLLDFKLPRNMDAYPELGNTNFECTTTYPGLLIGTGYPHGSGVMGEFKIGFFFDYTTGLPVIPGSSVKGLLRSAFPETYFQKEKSVKKKAVKTDNGEQKKKLEEEAENWGRLGTRRKLFIETLLKEMKVETEEVDFIKRLEMEIFEGIYGYDGKENPKRFPLCQRDIFHDAIISASNTGRIFADDYITPHNKTKDDDGIPAALKNPTPIQMLKVLPEVTFRFQFDLKKDFSISEKSEEGEDSRKTIDRLLIPSERKNLFENIIHFLGIGAKTNVGYGQFEIPQKGDGGSDEPGTTKAKQPQFFNKPLNPKKRPEMEAVVIKSGYPNKVRVYVREDYLPELKLDGYRSPLPKDSVIIVHVGIKNKKEINQASFYKQKK